MYRDDKQPPFQRLNELTEAFRDHKITVAQVIEAWWIQIWGQKWPVRSFGCRHSLRGHQNYHLRQAGIREIEVEDLKSQFKFHLWSHWGHLDFAMASEAVQNAVPDNMDIRVIEVADFKSQIIFDLWNNLRTTLSKYLSIVSTKAWINSKMPSSFWAKD